MKFSKKLFSLLLILNCLILINFINDSYAKGTCANGCDKDTVQGAVDLSGTGIEKVAQYTGKATFEDTIAMVCSQYTTSSQNEFYGLTGDLLKDPYYNRYPLEDYFTKAECQAKYTNHGEYSPVLHLTVDDPCARKDFPLELKSRLKEKKKDPKLLTRALNAKDHDGYTLLDYLYWLTDHEKFHLPKTISCANEVLKFACANGGEYFAFKDKASCPQGNK